jgi:hypothetical protein
MPFIRDRLISRKRNYQEDILWRLQTLSISVSRESQLRDWVLMEYLKLRITHGFNSSIGRL